MHATLTLPTKANALYFTLRDLRTVSPECADVMAHGLCRIAFVTDRRTNTEFRLERVIVNGRLMYHVQAQ